jgi:hypothetical protein
MSMTDAEPDIDPSTLPAPVLAWDPAEEDPATEEFPTFEALPPSGSPTEGSR